jgi:hypothetical protein
MSDVGKADNEKKLMERVRGSTRKGKWEEADESTRSKG